MSRSLVSSRLTFAAKAGPFAPVAVEGTSETDWLVERAGFELFVPLREAPPSQDAPQRFRAVRPARALGGGTQKIEFASTAGNFYDGRMRQITNSWAMPRTSTSKSRPCTGGRAKCQAKPPDMAPRRTNSSARSGWMSKIV